MAVGRVKVFKARQGWGLIAVDGGDDLFFHSSVLLDRRANGEPCHLGHGQIVDFDIEDGPDGPVAANMQIVAQPVVAAKGAEPGGGAVLVGRLQGRVKFFKAKEGWGFIAVDGDRDGDGDGMFFHVSDFADDRLVDQRRIGNGQRVGLGIRQGHRGPKAFNVRCMPDTSHLQTDEAADGIKDPPSSP